MPDPLDDTDSAAQAIPVAPLIPVPSSSSLQPRPQPQPQPASLSKSKRDEEEMYDRFATLFSPPTPRASPSPTPPPIWAPPSKPKTNPVIPRRTIPESPMDDFGAFVSVPPAEDPLAPSSSFASFDEFDSGSRADTWLKEAKEASERKRRSLLDEFDDGLFSSGSSQRIEEPMPEPKSEEGSIMDLTTSTPPRHKRHSTSPHPSSSSTFPNPRRSPTLSHATLAPPVYTSSTSPEPPKLGTVGRSSSYQTLSHILGWSSSSKTPPASSSTTPEIPAQHTKTLSETLNFTLKHAPAFPSLNINIAPPSSSPFASHHAPGPGIISGAPGFRPDEYTGNWDKGYSRALDEELAFSRSSPGNGSNGDGSASSRELGLGSLIERKTGHVELKGRRETTVSVLDGVLADEIRTHLPALSRLPKTWTLLYSLDQHGISLNTLYSRCEPPPLSASGLSPRKGEVLVIKDGGDRVFGVFLGESLTKSRGGYGGGGESFLFTFMPSVTGDMVSPEISVWKSTHKNTYISLASSDFLGFGGGDGSYGLYLDGGLLEGSSARCVTFDNEVLCSVGGPSGGRIRGREVVFEVVGLEVWGVGG
ncbi:oxidation resistance protein 1 [Moniliophthora roreri MCA 2997]|uniref:Oxidation resistance protein 1 n=1 Tax=Moniliophthora roreri (strain MCA 2997) TaxID=1381753 RepID=V2Y6Q7_MONRO|nr:oxidation resistance protein 1 [Moniliophthora roreri MCA 2997]